MVIGRSRVAAMLAAACALALSACGSSPSAGSADGSNQFSGSTAAPTTAPTTTATASPRPNLNTYTQNFQGGYSAQASFGFLPVQHAGTVNIAGYTIPLACPDDFSSQTDAMVPYEIIVKNTTPNFNFKGLVETLQFTPSNEGPDGIEQQVGNGSAACTDEFGAQTTFNLQPGGQVVIVGALGYSNYYSPQYPNGQPNILSGTDMIVDLGNTQGYNDTSQEGNISIPLP